MVIAKVFSISLTFALAVGAQPSLRAWANAEAYDLASQAFAEPDSKQRITLLQDWVIGPAEWRSHIASVTFANVVRISAKANRTVTLAVCSWKGGSATNGSRFEKTNGLAPGLVILSSPNAVNPEFQDFAVERFSVWE